MQGAGGEGQHGGIRAKSDQSDRSDGSDRSDCSGSVCIARAAPGITANLAGGLADTQAGGQTRGRMKRGSPLRRHPQRDGTILSFALLVLNAARAGRDQPARSEKKPRLAERSLSPSQSLELSVAGLFFRLRLEATGTPVSGLRSPAIVEAPRLPIIKMRDRLSWRL